MTMQLSKPSQNRKTDGFAAAAALCFLLQTILHFRQRFVYTGPAAANITVGILKILAETAVAAGLLLSKKKLKAAGAAAGTAAAIGYAVLSLPHYWGPITKIKMAYIFGPSYCLFITLRYLFCIGSWAMTALLFFRPGRSPEGKGITASILYAAGEICMWHFSPNNVNIRSYGDEFLFITVRLLSTALAGIAEARTASEKISAKEEQRLKLLRLAAAVCYILFALVSGRNLLHRTSWNYNACISVLFTVSFALTAAGLLLSRKNLVIYAMYVHILETLLSAGGSVFSGQWADKPMTYWNGYFPNYLCTLAAAVLIVLAFKKGSRSSASFGSLAGISEILGAMIINIWLSGAFLSDMISSVLYPLLSLAMFMACASAPGFSSRRVPFTPLSPDSTDDLPDPS